MNHSSPRKSEQARDTVIINELAWHEQEAQHRYSLDVFLYDPPMFDSVVCSGLAFLDIKPHEPVLDMGCGEGKESLELAARGSWVISTDLSYVQLSRARQLVRKHCPQADIHFVQANAEALPFMSEAFRIIYGKAILHHLDIDASASEVKRLLQPKGRATFAEPMAFHPLFWLARRLTPQLRTKNEQPLDLCKLHRFAAFFDKSELEEYFLVTPFVCPLRLIRGGESLFRRILASLQRADRWLFDRFPSLRRLAWYALIKVNK